MAGKHAMLARSRVFCAQPAPGSPAGKGSICPDFPLCYISFPCAPPPQSAFIFRASRELSASPLGRLTPRLRSELPRVRRGGNPGARAGGSVVCAVPDGPRAGNGGGAPSLTRCSPSHADPETQGQMLGPQMPVACAETEMAATGPSEGDAKLLCLCYPLYFSTGSLFTNPTKLRSPSSLPPVVSC